MKRMMLMLVLSALILTGCFAHHAYETSATGKFEGAVDIRWLKPDRFLYVPNRTNPLRFTTADGRVFEPKPMYTDGGSIPRLFWSVPGYSPWAMGPAYIIHDWLFMAHHCNTPGYEQVSFDDSARIMGASIKTLMEADTVPKDETLFFNVVEAVRSPVAKRIWEKGDCDLPSDAIAYGTAGAARDVLRYQSVMLDQKVKATEERLKGGPTQKSAVEAEATVKGLRRRADETRRAAEEVERRDPLAPASELVFKLDIGTISPGLPAQTSK
jgi:hypothetical protein